MPSVCISPAPVKTAPAAFVIFGWFPGEERQSLRNMLRRLWAWFRVQRRIRWLFHSLSTFNWKQWRSKPDHGRWPQTGEFNGGKLQAFPLNPEASCGFTGSAGIPATGRHAVVCGYRKTRWLHSSHLVLVLEPVCSGRKTVGSEQNCYLTKNNP